MRINRVVRQTTKNINGLNPKTTKSMNDKFSERLISVLIDYIPITLQRMFSQHNFHSVIRRILII